MSDAAFLRSIIAAPDDDLPRLVYADWLDENGDPDRAELIRVQCELAKMPDHDPRRRSLEDREHELLGEHEVGWLSGLPGYIQEWEWRRGFVYEVSASLVQIQNDPNESFAGHPVTSLRAVPHPADSGDEDDWFRDRLRFRAYDWSSWTWVKHLQRLDLSPWDGVDADFVTNESFAGVREWNLTDQITVPDLPWVLDRMPGRAVIRLMSFGGWNQTPPGVAFSSGGYSVPPGVLVSSLLGMPLEKLNVRGANFHSSSLHDLLAAPFAATLKHLDISDNPIAPDAYKAFQHTHRSLRLDKLDVSGTPLAGISLEPLLNSPALESLTKLEMNGCGSARRNMEVLARSPFWRQATELRAHSGTIPASTLEPLCGSSGPPALRLLDLADNYVRSEGVCMLCESPWAGSLTWLALSGNYLDDEACRLLARSGRFTHLRTLHLAHNNVRQDRSNGEQITDRGVQAMADDPSLNNLRLLTLSYTGLTDRGVEIAVNAPYWRLFGLGLSGNNLTPAAVRVLADSPRLIRFVWLDLSDNPRLRGQALRPLAESPHLSRMCELDCGGIVLDDDVRAIFRERLGPRFSH
jgi:uncharacterized protein (TIGR02996 family)